MGADADSLGAPLGASFASSVDVVGVGWACSGAGGSLAFSAPPPSPVPASSALSSLGFSAGEVALAGDEGSEAGF